MKRSLFISLFLAWVVCCCAQPQDSGSSSKGMIRGGPFKWIPEVRSLGPLVLGEEIEFNFWLTNKSNRVVVIRSVSSNHQDVQVTESQKRIQPNEVAYVTALVKPRRTGKLKAEILVKTDYGNFSYSLKLYANCYKGIDPKRP